MALLQELEGGIICATAKGLANLGRAFGRLLKDGDTVALHGDLGVGKTTFTKGIAKALGITDSITSPTFNIMVQHIGTMNLMHIDAYRLDNRECLEVWDYVQRPCVIVIEWPEHLAELQESITHDIRITVRENGKRWITLRTSNKKIL
ncbi:MAG: tRNA (adenosine(37)-N6)-threonylcarbamoyltransferase complex ATPase subunit type 1 TsaE [Puniceicoccales bacterium]|jgi:tRNA threonylcarbamoyladenosine biosynthesis protein TsaE|nr:tRNA (adenosine(37)-N6)-threonylcarbamoyltransferase complex ATPase subunit type 1 TsaE [Puniceicoccales bacterium]